MAQSHPFSMIGHQFVSLAPLEIIVDRYPDRNLLITDTDHKVLLKVKPHDTTFHSQCLLLDANNKPIAMLRQKNLSMHSGWNVFKGESKEDSDMIFSTKSEHLMQFKLNVRVMLPNNNDGCDLRIKGSWPKGNCTIYKGNSSIVVAQVVFVNNYKSGICNRKNGRKFCDSLRPNLNGCETSYYN